MRRIYDSGYAYYKYGTRSLVYYQRLYFGGGRQYGSGMTPFLGYTDYNLNVQQACYMRDSNGNYRYYMVERIHMEFSVWTRQIVALATYQNQDFTPLSSNRWLLIVGKDVTSSRWINNWGTWEWTSWYISVNDNRYKWIDDTIGPFNDGNGFSIFYFIYRQWTS